MNPFLSWKFWVFALVASIVNVILGNLISWPFVAGAWAGLYAVTNAHRFEVRK